VSISTHKPTQKNGGFTILELLIALALGLLVVSGIVQLFVGNTRTYEIVNAQARLQENARFSFEFISKAARTAGYFGCAPEDDNIVRHLGGNWGEIPEYNITEFVDGWENSGGAVFLPDDLTSLPRSEGGVNTNVHIANNGIDRGELNGDADILVFRTLRQPVARLAQTAQWNENVVADTPGGEPAFEVDDVVVVADCLQAAMFKVTGVAVAADQTTLQRGVAGGGLFDNAANVFTGGGDIVASTLSVVGRSYGKDAIVGVFESSFFFIADSTQLDAADNTIDALWQKVGRGAPVELVQGVEDMQILYGVDTSNDDIRNVNQYFSMDAVPDVTAIVAVVVTLTINSVESLADNNDAPLQRTFTKTIHVRNS